MKRLALILALLLPAMITLSQTKDKDGHTLVSLWKTYYKAEDADRPQDQLSALENIKKEALSKHLSWDYYDAATRYVSVNSNINWKKNREYSKALDEEIDKYADPVVVFYHYYNTWTSDRLCKYVEDNKETLLNSNNPEFYWKDRRVSSGRVYCPALLKLLKNDYEYTLWSLCLGNRKSAINDYYKGRYPEEAILEFNIADDGWSRVTRDKLQAYADKYKGKAVALLARQRVLNWDFQELNRDKKHKSEDYKALRAQCTEFERERKTYTGTEKYIADCCHGAADLAETLDGKEINTSVKDSKLTVTVRNLQNVKLQILKDDKTAWETTLNNKKCSYYILDTIKADIPALDDATYEIKCKSGSTEDIRLWRKYSLSIALRPDSKGYGVFVADYQSGKPVEKCELQLLDADGKLITTAQDFRPDGFSPLPEEISGKMTKGRFLIQAQYRDSKGLLHASQSISTSPFRKPSHYEGANVQRAVLLTDRKAFNPGEMLQFKAICYTGTYDYKPAPEGKQVTVKLYDPQDNELHSIDLTTNDFGSVSGSFPLDGGSRGGLYTLKLLDDGRTLTYTNIRVDEFVLPTFELIWDKDTRLYLPGDEIVVSGRVKAYSGHSAGKAVVNYDVQMGYSTNKTGELKLDRDGRFTIRFKAEENDYRWSYPVNVQVTDGTGETLSFSTYKRVYSTVPLSLDAQNTVPGKYSLAGESYASSGWIFSDSTADILFSTGGLDRESLVIRYIVVSDNGKKTIAEGGVKQGEIVRIPIASLSSGLYHIETKATAESESGKQVEAVHKISFVKASDSDTALDMQVSSFFKETSSDGISLQIGSTDGPVWAVAELFGSGNVLLEHQIVTLDGQRARKGSLKTIAYERRPEWPESLSLSVLWFHKGECYRYTRSILLPVPSISLPLEFTRFTEKIRPGEECKLIIKTLPDVECAATVFDKATETIRSNTWEALTLTRRPEPGVYYSTVCGIDESQYGYYDDGVVYRTVAKSMSVNGAMVEESMPMAEAAVAETADSASPAEPEIIEVRENFDATMAWEPLLHSDSDGNIELKFKGVDRLSTYYVQLFAHGKDMHNSTLRREMLVTIPVKISLVEPQFLYEGDLYTARATLASNMEKAVPGRMAIRFYDSKDWRGGRVLATKTAHIDMEPMGSGEMEAPFRVPAGIKELGVLVNFVPDDGGEGSDALFVTIPVEKPLQTLTEAHSGLLRDPSAKEALIAELRSRFVNIDASSLEPKERSIIDMVREAIPDMIEPVCKDAMSLTEAWYSNLLARKLGAEGLSDEALQEIADRIAACQTASGGISWFEGMESSVMITAALLQRIAAMPDGLQPAIDIEAAVKFLDSSYFGRSGLPWWCGGISLAQYLQTRALYPSVPFKLDNAKALRRFKKEVKAYLVPTGKRGLNARILDKARRLRTLQLLASSEDGVKLAKSWGITIKKSILRSLDADVESLLQYAVEHQSGATYYPNAVMPWRGLMESELYAHSLLCDLMTDVAKGTTGKVPSYQQRALSVAEGIRLWLMIQKETQQWNDDAACLEAIASVLRGTPETLNTKVILLSGSFTKPFEEVKASGNGFTVSCAWSVNGVQLTDGMELKVGDKVRAYYEIWNEENRSFVRICAPRPASFRPVEQLSGLYGWSLAVRSFGGWSLRPQGYRNVLKDKTEYWFDCYPEEDSRMVEEFYVTQAGEFQTPVIEIESLYAPHYRANGEGRGPVVSR